MAALEELLRGRPVYTKELFELFKKLRNHAAQHNGSNDSLMAPDVFGKFRYVWHPQPGPLPEVEIQCIGIQELSPEFQMHDFPLTFLTQEVYVYNNVRVGMPEYIPLPMVLSEVPAKKEQGLSNSPSLSKFKTLWKESISARLLLEKFINATQTSVQIKKIVAFGLGSIKDTDVSDEDSCVSHLQHLALITIASALNQVYQAENPSTAPVEIILQDPEYINYDQDIWTAEYNNVRLVQNPDGFLAIDGNTLVVNGFIPYHISLLSICADLLPNGPAGFIHEKIELNPNRRCWSAAETGTPKVVKLLENYEVSNFDDHPLEQELYKAYKHEKFGQLSYRLWNMQCFLKPKPKQS